jgi:hypothetical protein
MIGRTFRQRPEHEVDAGFRIIDHGHDTFARDLDALSASVPIQDQGRNEDLQSERRADYAQLNRLPVAREQDCDSKNDCDPGETDKVAHCLPRLILILRLA